MSFEQPTVGRICGKDKIYLEWKTEVVINSESNNEQDNIQANLESVQCHVLQTYHRK